MQTVVIVIHLLIVIVLVGVVLIQRSEGGGLGIGGGSGFMTARGSKNALTRLTAILAAGFFLTSIVLTVLQAIPGSGGSGILDKVQGASQGETPGGIKGNILDQLGSPAAGQEQEDNAAVPGNGNTSTPPSQSEVPN